jgi:hypothetical protein
MLDRVLEGLSNIIGVNVMHELDTEPGDLQCLPSRWRAPRVVPCIRATNPSFADTSRRNGWLGRSGCPATDVISLVEVVVMQLISVLW